MPQPANLMNRIRYILLAVLTVAIIGYGFYLYRMYVPATPPEPPAPIAVTVLADGSVKLDGTVYTTVEQIKPKIAQLQHDTPGTSFSIVAPKGDDFQGIAKAVVLMQNAGANKVTVTLNPASR